MIARMVFIWLVALVAAFPPAIAAQDITPPGVAPVAIRIPQALVDTVIEPLAIPGGTLEEPSGTWVVGWYEESGGLGGTGIPLLYAYREFRDVGPAAFYFLDRLVAGDVIEITGTDSLVYSYHVASVDAYDVATTDLGAMFAPNGSENLMLFTNAPPYDPVSGYQTTVMVRAMFQGTAAADPSAGRVSAPGVPACAIAPRALALPGGSIIPGPAPDGARDLLDLPNASVTDDATVTSIQQGVQDATGCALAVREAVTLQDGRVLALLGPDGSADLEMLTADEGLHAIPVDPAGTAMEFAIFTSVDGGWQAEPVPWSW